MGTMGKMWNTMLGIEEGGEDLRVETQVSLTEVGRTKLENYSLKGLAFTVAANIQDSGGQTTIGEISDETHIITEKVKRAVLEMKKNGQVRIMSGS